MPRTIDRPDCEVAHGFTAAICGDPKCGLHLIPVRRDDSPICEMIIGRRQLLTLLDYVHERGLDLPQ